MEGFKPFGVPLRSLGSVVLLFEEYEALRLADYLALSHKEAARQMKVSRPTFTRVYEKARRTLSTALVEGKAILIEGGNYQTNESWCRCGRCSRLLKNSPAQAVCPACHSSSLHHFNPAPGAPGTGAFRGCPRCKAQASPLRGEPCRQTRCPHDSATKCREHALKPSLP